MSNWNPWNGGKNPAPGCVVEVMCADGSTGKGRADDYRWTHSKGHPDAHIIAYRIVESERDRVVQKACEKIRWSILSNPSPAQLGCLYDAGFLKDPDSDEKIGKISGDVYLCPHCYKTSRMEW